MPHPARVTASQGRPPDEERAGTTKGELLPARAVAQQERPVLPAGGLRRTSRLAAVPLRHAARTAAAATRLSRAADQVAARTAEQLFHIHAHLAIFVNGKARQVPAAIGVPGAQAQQTPNGPFIAAGTCFYWLHTHAPDGIIHIESPVVRTYTLGEFFDEWGQPLGPGQVGPATGRVVALYDGQVYQGDPRDIPLTAHAQIQLDIGTPLIAPQPVTFPAGL